MSTSTYTPGTKLSYANGTECCTVLTNGNSLVTKVWGHNHWEQMWLADWLILANGDEQEDYIPLSTETKDEFADLPPLVPCYEFTPISNQKIWEEAGRKVAPKRRIGTKLKWVLDDETYRVAVVTKHGVCQVKAITEGGGDCYYVGDKRYLTKRTFDSEASWRSNLPEGGEVFVY